MTPYAVVAHNIDPQADNAIHGDDVAQQLGFTGALVPGVELFAYAASALVGAWGEHWLTGGELDLRFRRPVYDGEQLVVTCTDGVVLVTGPDGVVRCVGSAAPAPTGTATRMRGDPGLPAPHTHPHAGPPATSPRPHAGLPALRAGLPSAPVLGPFASVTERGTSAYNDDYLDAVSEPLPLFRESSLAHPGLLLRLVNLLLMRNVSLGPWIHTATRARLLAPCPLPALMTVHGTVTELWTSKDNDYVRYDATVLADNVPVLAAEQTAIYRLGSLAVP